VAQPLRDGAGGRASSFSNTIVPLQGCRKPFTTPGTTVLASGSTSQVAGEPPIDWLKFSKTWKRLTTGNEAHLLRVSVGSRHVKEGVTSASTRLGSSTTFGWV